MSSMSDVRDLAQRLEGGEKGPGVSLLVNNAGCMVHERTVTPEGIEVNPKGPKP